MEDTVIVSPDRFINAVPVQEAMIENGNPGAAGLHDPVLQKDFGAHPNVYFDGAVKYPRRLSSARRVAFSLSQAFAFLKAFFFSLAVVADSNSKFVWTRS